MYIALPHCVYTARRVGHPALGQPNERGTLRSSAEGARHSGPPADSLFRVSGNRVELFPTTLRNAAPAGQASRLSGTMRKDVTGPAKATMKPDAMIQIVMRKRCQYRGSPRNAPQNCHEKKYLICVKLTSAVIMPNGKPCGLRVNTYRRISLIVNAREAVIIGSSMRRQFFDLRSSSTEILTSSFAAI